MALVSDAFMVVGVKTTVQWSAGGWARSYPICLRVSLDEVRNVDEPKELKRAIEEDADFHRRNEPWGEPSSLVAKEKWPQRQAPHTWNVSPRVSSSIQVQAGLLSSHPHQHQLWSLLKKMLLTRATCRDSDSGVLGWAPVICILTDISDYSDRVEVLLRLGKHWIIGAAEGISQIDTLWYS